MNLEQSLLVLEEADCLADRAAVEAAIERMAGEITRQLGEQMPLVFCVMNGGLIVTGQLLTRLGFPLEVGYLHASRYGLDYDGIWRNAPGIYAVKGM